MGVDESVSSRPDTGHGEVRRGSGSARGVKPYFVPGRGRGHTGSDGHRSSSVLGPGKSCMRSRGERPAGKIESLVVKEGQPRVVLCGRQAACSANVEVATPPGVVAGDRFTVRQS